MSIISPSEDIFGNPTAIYRATLISSDYNVILTYPKTTISFNKESKRKREKFYGLIRPFTTT